MNHIGKSKLVLLSAMLALGGLTMAAAAAPAAHAALAPTISVTGQGGGAQVYGWNFTAGVPARVELLDGGLGRVLTTQYITPWLNVTHAYGVFDTLLSTGYTGPAWVAVDQRGHATVWAKTYIYHAPHIVVTPGALPSGGYGIHVNGSGYTPGATVRVEVMDSGFTKVLNTQYVTAVKYGVEAGTFLAMLGAPCGTVHVLVDGLPGPTQGATIAIC